MKLMRIAALLAALLLLALFVYLVLQDKNPSSYITVAVLLVFMVLATRLDDITNLNFGATGLQARLEQNLREAQATIAQLQDIAEVFGVTTVQQITLGDRWDGTSSKGKREAIQQIEQALRSIKLPEDRIQKTLETQRKYDLFDYFFWVTNGGIPQSVTQKQLDGFTTVHQVFHEAGVESLPSIDDVEAHFRRHEVIDGETFERLADWRFYEKNGTHRRVEQWDRRHQ